VVRSVWRVRDTWGRETNGGDERVTRVSVHMNGAWM
jgi:hypothetical protein